MGCREHYKHLMSSSHKYNWCVTHRHWSSIAKSVNGWTNGKLGYKWVTKVFDPTTKEAMNGFPHVLLLDDHSLHYTKKFCHNGSSLWMCQPTTHW
jgi:hypothetical protein